MKTHIMLQCEQCHLTGKKSSMSVTPSKHILCWRCSRSSGSFHAFDKADKEMRALKRMRRPISNDEQHLLWQLNNKKISLQEFRQRMDVLRRSIVVNHKIALEANRKLPDETFKDKYRKMKESYK